MAKACRRSDRSPKRSAHPRARGEHGSAVVELALVAPLLLSILLWAVAFGEFATLRIRQQEVSRFLTWEATTYAPSDPGAALTPARIRGEVMERTLARYTNLEGQNLSSRRSGWLIVPAHLEVDANGLSLSARAPDELGAEVMGGIAKEGPKGNSLLPTLSGLLDGIEGAWTSLLSHQGFSTDDVGIATEVRLRVDNRLIPPGAGGIFPRLRSLDLAPATSSLETETWALADGADVGLGSDHPFRTRVRRIAHLGVGSDLDSKSKGLAGYLAKMLPALDARVVSQRYVDPVADTSKPGCDGSAWAATGKWRNGPKVGTPADGMSPVKCFDTLPMEANGLGAGYQGDPLYRIFRARGAAKAGEGELWAGGPRGSGGVR